MTKRLFFIITGIVTFLLGGFAVLIFQVQPQVPNKVEITEPQVIPEYNFDCKKSRIFPGVSKPLLEIKKYKNGFFPINAFNDGWQNFDASINNWYGKHLKQMNERSLLNVSDENKEVYRFLWLRTFDHPVSVRLERDGYSFKLTSVELDGAGGYEPGKLFRTDNVQISRDQWCAFMALLENSLFWSQETNSRDDSGNDGSQWVLEGVRGGRYHIVDRWTPMSGGFREACLFLLKLSGREPESLRQDLY